MNIDSLLENRIDIISSRLSEAEAEFFLIAAKRLKKIFQMPRDKLQDYLNSLEFYEGIASDMRKVKKLLEKAHERNKKDMGKLCAEAVKTAHKDGIEFNGEHYTLYEAEQEQRRLETEMRRTREELNMWKEVRELDPRNEREYQRVKARLAGLRNEYKELGAALQPKAIRMKMERSYVPKGSTGNPVIPPFFKTNTSLGAMAERFYVKTGMKTTNDRWHIQEGSYVTGIRTIAKGTKIKDIERLKITYPLQNGACFIFLLTKVL